MGGNVSSAGTRPSGIDWGLGEYEVIARQLEPAAERAVALARVAQNERVLDVATGTGNAALAAARRGALATGVDMSARLIEVARSRASSEGIDTSFLVGDIHDLPVKTEAFDCVLSVFGLIFAADPGRAISEVMQALTPAGRAVITIWVPAGPLHEMIGVFSRAVTERGAPQPPPFPWHDRDVLEEQLEPYGVDVDWHDEALTVTASSAEAYLDEQERSHPMSIASRPQLEDASAYRAIRGQALAILRQGNESPDSFRITSPYRAIAIQRRG